MDGKSSKNSKSHRTAAMLFAFSGIIFIILSSISHILFLPIGIALFIIGIGFWQQSKKLSNS